MAKLKTQKVNKFSPKTKKRKGRASKKSINKNSKYYVKPYAGQGK